MVETWVCILTSCIVCCVGRLLAFALPPGFGWSKARMVLTSLHRLQDRKSTEQHHCSTFTFRPPSHGAHTLSAVRFITNYDSCVRYQCCLHHQSTETCLTKCERKKPLLSLWDSRMLHNPAQQKHIYSETNRESDNQYKYLQWKEGTNTQWNRWTDGNTDDLSRSTTFTQSFCNHHSFVVLSSIFSTNMYNVRGYFAVKTMKKIPPKSSFILWLIYGIISSAAVFWNVQIKPCQSN